MSYPRHRAENIAAHRHRSQHMDNKELGLRAGALVLAASASMIPKFKREVEVLRRAEEIEKEDQQRGRYSRHDQRRDHRSSYGHGRARSETREHRKSTVVPDRRERSSAWPVRRRSSGGDLKARYDDRSDRGTYMEPGHRKSRREVLGPDYIRDYRYQNSSPEYDTKDSEYTAGNGYDRRMRGSYVPERARHDAHSREDHAKRPSRKTGSGTIRSHQSHQSQQQTSHKNRERGRRGSMPGVERDMTKEWVENGFEYVYPENSGSNGYRSDDEHVRRRR